MGEFVFRNLSVKVFPVARDEAICSDATVTVMECTPCTELCTGTFTPCDDLCTREPSIPIAVGPVCNSPGTNPGFVDTRTNIILPAGDAVAELASLKNSLRIAMSAVEVCEERLQSDEGFSTGEGIDRLRDELLGAVAELDNYRGRT